jgi:TonB-dependent starch-binding outer membrane protein SusC
MKARFYPLKIILDQGLLSGFLLLWFFSLFSQTSFAQGLITMHESPPASRQERPVEKQKPLSQTLRELEKLYQVTFVYENKLIDGKFLTNDLIKQVGLDEKLNTLLPQFGLKYKKLGKGIYSIGPDKDSNKGPALLNNIHRYPILAAPMDFAVGGKVTNEKGEGMVGVTIVLKGSTMGTSTDPQGHYSLSVPNGNGVLVFSFIGYLPQEIPINNRSAIQVSMALDVKALEEVVVVGYGTQPTKEITGTLQSISTKDLGDAPVSTVGQMLQGKLSGVTVNETTGRPGEGLRIRIRGAASLTAGSEPLYVVDGMPISGDISNIDFNQIESITVLKDAAATSLYGSRAANGVVLVQTKQAVAGRMQVGFNSFVGLSYIPQNSRLEMMNAREYAQFSKEVAELNGRPVNPVFQNPEQYGEGTDWFDEITRTAPIQNYSLTVGAGTEKFRTTAMLGYLKQEGVVLGTGYTRFSFRMNSEYKPFKKLRIGINVAPTYATNSNFDTDGNRGFIVGGSLLTTPLASPYNPDGSLALTATDPTKSHPNWLRVARETVWEDKDIQLLTNAFAEYEILKGLKARTSANVELGNSSLFKFFPSTVGNGLNNPPPRIPRGTDNESQYTSWLNENTLNYQTERKGHSLDVLVGFTAQNFRSEGNSLEGTNFPDDKVQAISAAARVTVSSSIQEWALLSTLARVNYNYKGKYLFTASIRQDGSSRFGPENRWGNFPSASLGWILTEESFWKLAPVSFLKLRASLGTVGNFAIGNYSHISTIGAINYPFGNSAVAGRAINNLGDRQLGWEKNKELNIGADVYLLKDRFQIMYNYYSKRSSDLLYNVQLPLSSGFSNMQTNIGELRLWGHDILIQTTNIHNSRFTWSSNLNLTINRNKVMALGTSNATLLSPGDRHISVVGQPIGMFYGLIWDGFYDSQEELDNSPKHAVSQVGTIKFKDLDNNGVITLADRAIIGNPWPDFTYGMTHNLKYKAFDFSFIVAGSYGNQVGARHEYTTANLDASYNVLKEVARRWKSPQDPGDGKYGSSQQGTTYVERDWWHTRFLRDGSFLTIKNITLGYAIPVKKGGALNSLRVYGSIQNAYVLTNYTGPNPEVSTSGSTTEQGIDDSAYPVPRTISLGVNFGL